LSLPQLKGGDTNGDEKEGCKQQEHEEIFTEEIFQEKHEEIRKPAVIRVICGAPIYSEPLAWPQICDLTHQPASYRGLFSCAAHLGTSYCRLRVPGS